MRLLQLLLFLSFCLPLHAQIEADVATSEGNFTIQLDHVSSPRTVANFIALAQGSRPWIDSTSGVVRSDTPFYNGLRFHRVVAGFVSQIGSPKGDGTDGPGYTFRDEFNNGLNHSSAYTVSMANTGPNSNGSQFFITAAAAPGLNDKHTVFGRIVAGQSVCDAINTTPTDANEAPLTPVTITSITIRRSGADAIAFDENAQGLPSCSMPAGKLEVQPGVSASWATATPQLAGTFFRFTRSEDLTTWQAQPNLSFAMGLDAPPRSEFLLGDATAPKAFYNISAAYHPQPTTPDNFSNKVVIIEAFEGWLRYTFNTDTSGGIIEYYTLSGTVISGNFSIYSGNIDPYQSTFIAETDLVYDKRQFITFVKCGWDNAEPTIVTGHHLTQNWNGLIWVDLSQGACTITR